MRRLGCVMLLLFFTAVALKAQSVAEIISNGVVTVQQDSSMMRLMKTDSTINANKKSFIGYRVQIFTGGSSKKEEAFEVKAKFLKLFPNERAYVVYTVPDFRVRVGNFRTKLNSIGLYKKCLRYFPNSYPVKTEIKFNDLLPEETTTVDSLNTANQQE